jgi:transcriptional regulator with XRE-family HTH domain
VSIGERLRQEREARGLTQQAMASLVQASERAVNDWERDVSSPKALALAALGVHGFDVGYIVTGQRDYEPPRRMSPEEQVLLEHWRGASRAVKSAAMAVLLSDGHTMRAGTTQQFNAPVGQVAQGDNIVKGNRYTLQDNRGAYVMPDRKRSTKAAKKR